MATYKLSQAAKSDLKRIYKHGVREFGEAQADKYFEDFFTRFEEIAENLFHYQLVNHIVEIMNIIGKQDIEEYLKNN